MNIRTLIIDDEQPARDLIATLLREEPDVQIVGECSSGTDAVNAIKLHHPDLVFLDVQMPSLDGFGVLASLPAERLPIVVFVTAFDRHAVRAFEAHAMDYLLKPFEYDRLRQAVNRARSQLAPDSSSHYQRRLLGLLEETHGRNGAWERLAVRESGRVIFVEPSEIDWVEAEGNYVRLHTGKKSWLLRETMNSAETRLSSRKFLRVSRSTLVNLERIIEWQPLFHGDSLVILRDGTRITISRAYREKFDQMVAQLI